MMKLKPMIPRLSKTPPDYVLYTDAAAVTNRIADIRFQGATPPPKVLQLVASSVPRFWGNLPNHRNIIFGLAMLGPLAFIFTNQKKLAPITIAIYIGNNNFLTSLARGDSGTDIISDMIALFWRSAEANSIDIWLGRSPSGRRPADLPTRHAPAPMQGLYENGT